MMRQLFRHLVIPAFETGFKRRKTFRYLNQLERTQWLDRASIEDLQFRALRRLIEHAHKNCPYYRREWDRLGLHPGRLAAPADIAHWPVIDAETVRAHRAEMRAANWKRPLIDKSTGGTTGVPIRFDLDLDSYDRRVAAAHRGYGWAGAEPGTNQLYLWGAPIGPRSRRANLKDRLYHGLYRRHVLNCLEMDDDLPARFAATLDRLRPDAVVAYTNPMSEIARRLEEDGVRVSHRPRAILVGAEKLHDFQRETIERVFGAPVFETYGSREFMLIGSECDRHEGLHLTAEHLLVEILADDGRPTPDGEEGNVVITDLYNLGMPFVRYANGDRAVAGFATCTCGRGLPLLRKVVGRRLDVLVATGGRVIPGEYFPYLVKDFPAVRRFQVVQDEPDRVRFAIASENMADADRTRLERLVREAFGPGVRVEFEPVRRIPLTPAGKLRVVINRIPGRRAG